MIEHKVGNLIKSVKTGHIAHGCNAKGVMGGGFAKFIRDEYPEVFTVYREHYMKHSLHLGDTIPVPVIREGINIVVWNCITQLEFGNDGKLYTNYNAVAECARKVNETASQYMVKNVVNFPLIGSGLGGAHWPAVEKILDEEYSGTW